MAFTSKKIFFFLLSIFTCISYGQTDSLKLALSTENQDSNKVKILTRLMKVNYKSGNFSEALKYAKEAAARAEKTGDKKVISKTLNNLGIVYKTQNNYVAALQSQLKGLQICTEMNDKNSVAVSLMNIGIIYTEQSDYVKALEYYNKALALKKETGNTENLGNLYNNVGNVYAETKNFEKAVDYYTLALSEKEKNKDTSGMALSIGLIANNYDRQNNKEKALAWYNRSLDLYMKTGDLHGSTFTLNNIGNSFLKRKKYTEAEKYLLKAFALAKKNNYLEVLKELNMNLSDLYISTGKMQKALLFYKDYISVRDSIYNEENTKKLVRTEMNFEFEKKEAAVKLEQEKKEAIALAESKKQKVIIWSVCGILLLVIGFAFFAYRSYLQKKKANTEISGQKNIIEEKQKEILDSIYYARRIQRALLPNEKYIQRILNTK